MIENVSNMSSVVNCEVSQVTEPLTAVMQAVIDRRPDLSSDSLDHFLSFVSKAGPDLNNSVKVGTLLMKFVSNYGKKVNASYS